MRIYRGSHDHDVEYYDEENLRRWQPLPPRNDLRDHSPTGFSWGYAGSGPAQLALALLAHVTGDDARAMASYQSFKRRMIAPLDMRAPWTFTAAEILFKLESIEETHPGTMKERIKWIREDLANRTMLRKNWEESRRQTSEKVRARLDNFYGVDRSNE